ncbi:MAG: N-acetylmuramoyl-L-alanine amidase [Myxococcota bacterium]
MQRTRLPLALFAVFALAPPAAGTPHERPEPASRVVATASDGDRAHVYLDLSAAALGTGPASEDPRLDEAAFESLTTRLLEAAHDADPRVRAIVPWVVDPARPDLGWQPLWEFLPPISPPPTRPRETTLHRATAPAVTRGLTGGHHGGAPLAGKVVYFSPGHGFYWSDPSVLGRWATQRGATHGVVEDFVNAEAVAHYLVPLLLNAGATVFTVRETDLQPNRVVVDAESGGTTSTEGGGIYEEFGTWKDSTVAGYRAGLGPVADASNPHARGKNRVAATTAGPGAPEARFTPKIPADGQYAVYVTYSQDASRARDAHYLVRHAGGQSHVRVNQERHGATWVLLGSWRFSKGQNPATGSVTLVADSALEPGDFVSADAVRFGGGMGEIQRGTGSPPASGPTSGRPRWEECSRYAIQSNGAPQSVWDSSSDDHSDDITARSRYAAWQNEPGEDAVYVSWHTNAPDGGRGTSTYVYGPNPVNNSYQFTGTPGSDVLANLLQDEIVNDIRSSFVPTWKDRGVYSAYFGELNPSHNSEMPAALVEAAFHATEADAVELREPRFRYVLARAFQQAIVKYFAVRDGLPARLLPDPPTSLSVRAEGPTSARLRWKAPPTDTEGLAGDAATGYVIYRSRDGRAFDDGLPLASGATSALLTSLPAGVPTFFRVTATNAGGESMPTSTVGVLLPCAGGKTEALVVQGFYRLDFASAPREDLSPFALGVLGRFRQSAMNTYDYVVEHGLALADAGVPFDSAEASAVVTGDAPLSAYRWVDWQLGEESTIDSTLDPTERGLLADWLGEGGGRALVISGAELLWDLEAKGDTGSTAFAQGTLGAGYVADDANTYGLAAGTGPLAGIGPLSFDDGTQGTYDVDYPDVLSPLGGAQTILAYDNGAGAAATRLVAAQGYRAYVFGFPLETLVSPEARSAVMAALVDDAGLNAPLPCAVLPPDSGPEPGPEPGPEADPELTEPAPESDPELTGEPSPEPLPDAAALPDFGADSLDSTDAVERIDAQQPEISKPPVGVKGIVTTTDSSLVERRDGGCSGARDGALGGWGGLALLASLALAFGATRRRISRGPVGRPS